MWKEVLGFWLHFVLAYSIRFPFDKLDRNAYRLPIDILPTRYVLELQPDFYTAAESPDPSAEINHQIHGSVQIFMDCIRSTDKIVLHSVGLEINEQRTQLTEIGDVRNKSVPVTWSTDEAKEFLIATLNEATRGGNKYSLTIEFKGKLESKDTGIYVHNYTTAKNETEFFVATNLAPTFARFVFPCFDEPQFKAEFDITVLRKKPYHVLSNMPIAVSRERGDGWIADQFQTTVKMSTYILGVFVSQFRSIETKTRRGVLNRLWSKSDDVDKLQFFSNYTATVLQKLEDYFDIPFPLPKLDHIAHPFFRYNAMENWGIIMYKATRLVYDPDHNDPIALNTHMYTAAHEIGHMFFGNRVTMKWWTDLWLKEGFAELLAVSLIGPSGSPSFSEEYFCIQKRRLAMWLDSYSVANPTRYPYCETRKDIFKAYNKYTLYSKGGVVNRMFQFALGNETFKVGLQKYLNTYRYKAVRQFDLIDSLQKSAERHGDRDGSYNVNVTSLIGTWTWQPGYPLVVIDYSNDRKSSFKITQERFLYPGLGQLPVGHDDASTKKMMKLKYDVPLLVRSSCDAETTDKLRTIWLHHENPGFTRLNNQCGGWLMGNAGGMGYYRVHYARDLWKKIADQLHKDHSVFTTLERAIILDDAFALMKYGKLDFDVFMDVISYVSKERRFLPWRVFLPEIEDLHFAAQSHTRKISAFIRDMVSEIYDSLKWEPMNDEVESELSRDIIKAACSHQYPPCILQAGRVITSFREEKTYEMKITGLNLTFACSAQLNIAEDQRRASMDKLLVKIEAGTADKDKDLPTFYSLVCNQNLQAPKDMFRQIFSNATKIDSLPKDILHLLLMRVLEDPGSLQFALEILNKTMEDDLKDRNDSWSGLLNDRSVISRMVGGINSDQEIDMFKNIMRNNDPTSSHTYIIKEMNAVLDRITNNIAWKKLNQDNLVKLDYKVTDGVGRWQLVDTSSSVKPEYLLILSIILIKCIS